jgi:hypothetical protein
MFDFSSLNLGAALKALTPRVTVPFAGAAWILLYVHTKNLMALPPAVVVTALVIGVLCSCLALSSLVAALWGLTAGARRRVVQMFLRYRDKKRIETELGFLTPKEREIISYLLAKNQKMFEVLPDGEEAATLIAKGFVVYSVRRPLALHRDVAVEIPAHVWAVLVKHREKFPYEVRGSVAHPWRTPWMAR